METEVPLWLALALYKMKRCRINPPQWLAVDELKGNSCFVLLLLS
jgi:hypothetical protein